jgi:hypothetical protein
MDEKKASSWDDLLHELGAQPAPEALERRPAIETQFEPPVAGHAPKSKRGDWNALADQLGVDVPAEEPPRPRGTPSQGSASRGGNAEAMEASFAEIEPMESAFEEIMEEDVSDVEFEIDEEFGAEDESGEVEDSGALSGEAARSAFEALFQAGSFTALPAQEKPPRKPEGRPGPQWRDINERARQTREEKPPGELEELEGEQPRVRSGERDLAEDRDRPRRRRRRGRGRGRQQDEPSQPRERSAEGEGWEEHSEDVEAEGEAGSGERDSEDTEEGEQHPRRRRRRGRGGRSSSAERAEDEKAEPADLDESFDDDEDEESAHDHDDEGDADDDSPRGSHKSIPTWSEAIGVMVETNMQARNSSPQRPGPSRERGRGGRGRGRGGRGRRS